MPNDPTADVPTLRVSISVNVPPLVIDFPSAPSSPIPPTITISGPDSKLAKAIYQKLVKSSDRRAFVLVLASPHITEEQKRKLQRAFNKSFKQISDNMFESFVRLLRKLDKLRKQLEAQAAGPTSPPAQEPPPEPPEETEPGPPEPVEDEDAAPPPPKMDYTGTERGVELESEEPPDPDVVYEMRHPAIPEQAVPIYDQEVGAIIGYRAEVATGVYKDYDLGGNVVGMSEKPLETPFLDLADLFLIAGAGLKLIFKGALRLRGLAGAVKSAQKLDPKLVSLQSIVRMRAFFKGELGDLKFAPEPLRHMKNPHRYVPTYHLDMAIKYGKAAADPKGRKGALMYTHHFRRARKRSITPEELKKSSFKEYLLKVVVRAKDRTVLHFHYEDLP